MAAQADSKNTTRTPRNRGRDQIFARLAEYKKCSAAVARARAALDRIKDIDERIDHLGIANESQGAMLWGTRPARFDGHQVASKYQIGHHLQHYLYHEEGLRWLPPKAARKVKRMRSAIAAEIMTMVRKAAREHEALRVKSGWRAAFELWCDASAKRHDALKALLATTPTTLAGHKALGAFIVETLTAGAGPFLEPATIAKVFTRLGAATGGGR